MNINGDIGNNTVIVGDFNSPLTSMDRPSRQKVNKETVALNDTLDNNMSLPMNGLTMRSRKISKDTLKQVKMIAVARTSATKLDKSGRY